MATGTIRKFADGNDSGWITDDNITDKGYDPTIGHIYYRKIGNLVEVKGKIQLSSSATGSTAYKIGALPSEYRPQKERVSMVGVNALTNFDLQIGININGNILCYAGEGRTWPTEVNTYFQTMYFV